MQQETSEQPSESEPTSEPGLKTPRTVFAEFDDAPVARKAIELLKSKVATGMYSLNSPTAKGGCRIAIQVEGSKVSEAQQIITEAGGTPGSVATPRRTEKPEKPAAADAAEGATMPAATKEKPKAKAKAASKVASPRFGKKIECKAPGHGEYGDIESHNKKHHGGKAFVVKATAAAANGKAGK